MVEYTSGSGELDRVFAAISDPTRRAILAALASKPSTVTEIARPFPVSLNAISKHVMVLERAGLVRREIRGRVHHCTLEAQPLKDATEWLQHYRQFWELRLDALENFVLEKKKQTPKTGGTHVRTKRRR